MSAPAAAIWSRLERLMPRRMPEQSTLFYALYTSVLFLISFLITFPSDLIARRFADQLEANTGWSVRYETASLLPWDGYRFSELRLIPPGKQTDPWFRGERMSVRPPLSAFLGRGLSRAGFHGRAYGGDLSGVISRGEVSSLDLSWTDLRPGDYPPLAALVAGNWEGKLSGEIHLAGKEDLRSIEGGGKLTLRGAALTGGNVRGFTIPDLHSTQGDGEFEIKGGRLEIKTLKLAGAEVDLDVRGQLFLRSPLAESVVNATVNVKPIPGANPGIEALLTMLNRNQRPASGTYTLTLYGVLNAVKVR